MAGIGEPPGGEADLGVGSDPTLPRGRSLLGKDDAKGEATCEFIVKDASGRALAYFYWWGDVTMALLTRDEAKCLAEKFAKLPNIMAHRREGG
jgi:hypothetical protein